VESRQGEGSTFRFTLKAQDGALPQPSPDEQLR